MLLKKCKDGFSVNGCIPEQVLQAVKEAHPELEIEDCRTNSEVKNEF